MNSSIILELTFREREPRVAEACYYRCGMQDFRYTEHPEPAPTRDVVNGSEPH